MKLHSKYHKKLFKQYKKVDDFKAVRGEFFIEPENATFLYGVDFSQLQKDKHCKLEVIPSQTDEGLEALGLIAFTDKGIKELIRTNDKIRYVIASEYLKMKEIKRRLKMQRE